MRHLLLAACATLAACSPATTGNRTADPADVNAAAAEAQGDIDAYAADSGAAGPTTPASTQTAAATTPPDATALADDPGAIVRGYFEAIAAGRYADAYRVWEGAGEASGLTARQFADSFAKYESYRAEVGVPGRVDAGAGQRYVEVPVRVTGTLVEGDRPFALRGTIVLHKTGDIDGATAEQRRWHIRDSTLRPRPDEAGPAAVPTPES